MFALGLQGVVVGIDVNVAKAESALATFPLRDRIALLQGDSASPAVVAKALRYLPASGPRMVVLDSDHSRAHVARELAAWASVVTPGSLMVVLDGVMRSVADAPRGSPEWASDGPADAVDAFLASTDDFRVEPAYNRFGPTFAPGGFLRRSR